MHLPTFHTALPPFADRHAAGRLLAQKVVPMGLAQPLVLALPRGGVPVAAEVARALHAPLDIVLVRKIGSPYQPELALAAVVEGHPPHVVLDEPVYADIQTPAPWFKQAVQKQLQEIERRRQVYLHGQERVPIRGRTVVLVDDGIATGTTMRAALQAVHEEGAARVVLAIPVAPPQQIALLQDRVDDIACLATPWSFDAVGAFYRDFHQLSDDEVIDLLDKAREEWTPGQTASSKG